jgi:GIY-YIG catalytic domain
MKQYGYIYIHRNKINGHIYVGQSIQAPERRFRKGANSFNSYKTCPAFHAALEKYGWEGFETQILLYAEDQDALNFYEEYFINYYQSADGVHGYNSNWFSEGRGKQSESTKDKIREKAKLRKGKMGPAANRKEYKIINGLEYKHCSRKDHWLSLDKFNSNVSKWDNLNMYCAECQAEQSREQKNKRKNLLTDAEFQKSYENRKFSEGQKRRRLENPESFKGKTKEIIRIDPNTLEEKFYKSGLEVKADGFDNTYVSQVCNGKRKMFKGYYWRFVEKETGPKDPESNKKEY